MPLRIRLGVVLVGLLTMIGLGAGAPTASAALPPQGLYEECAPVAEAPRCVSDLDQLGGAGFQAILNYEQWWSTPEQVTQYAAAAQSAGVKVIWPLKEAIWRNGGDLASYYPSLAGACSSCGHEEFVRYVVNMVKGLPATWGYYIGDEVSPAEAPQVAALAALIKSVDPNHPLLLVATEPSGTGANLNPLASSADVLAADPYPWGWPDSSLSEIGSTTRLVQNVANASHRQSAMVLQAFDWSQYPETAGPVSPTFPTEAAMLQERDEALDNGSPSLLLWYSLFDIQRSTDPAGNWADLVAAAFEGSATTTAASAAPTGARSARTPARCARHKAKRKTKTKTKRRSDKRRARVTHHSSKHRHPRRKRRTHRRTQQLRRPAAC